MICSILGSVQLLIRENCSVLERIFCLRLNEWGFNVSNDFERTILCVSMSNDIIPSQLI
jgi:hypothetical protein